MYNSIDIAENIRSIAKTKNIIIKQMFKDIGLGLNTMSNLKTSFPKADNIAKIADYLNCSIDELMGRHSYTDNNISPTADSISKSCSLHTPININNSLNLSKQEKDLLRIYRNSNGKDQVKIMSYVYSIEDEYAE